MQITNPLQINDWEIKKFLTVVLVIQLAIWGIIGLNAINLQIPILREFIGLLYLTFIPGILILRILNLHKLGNIKTILYSIGLSIATLMFTGFFMNILFPLFGVSRPISSWPLLCTISLGVIILSIFAYIRDRSFSFPEQISLLKILSPPVLVLSLFPFCAIGGTYIANFYNSNLLLMILFLFIALVPMLVVFTRFFPEKYYPYAIFTLAIALLYQRSLISMYVWGWDIQLEYYITNSVIQNAYWDSTIYNNLNAMLSLVILAPIYSLILNMGLDWVFKIIYPFLFAFVPLGLFAIFRKQTDEKIAFFSCFFFISFFAFFFEMLQLARQEIAELFLVLIILSMIDSDLNKFPKSVFFIIFSASLIVSHYGLCYLFMFMLLFAWAIAALGYHISSRKYIVQFYVWVQGKAGYQNKNNLQKYSFRSNPFSFFSVIYYCFFSLLWYIYLAGSSPFDSIVIIGNHIGSAVSSEFLNPKAAEGIALITTEAVTPLHDVARYLHLLTMFFIVIGFIISALRHLRVQFDFRYLLLSSGALCICIGGVVLPYFANALNTSRLYQISLIFLAPFCILGGITIFRVISDFFKVSWTNNCLKNSLQILSVFLALYLLFNSGWIYEVTNDHQIAFLNLTIDSTILKEQEFSGAKWLIDVKNEKLIYVDEYRWWLLRRFNPQQIIGHLPNDANKIPEQSYVHLGNFNIKNKLVLIKNREKDETIAKYIDTEYLLTNRSRIYANGCTEVYFR